MPDTHEAPNPAGRPSPAGVPAHWSSRRDLLAVAIVAPLALALALALPAAAQQEEEEDDELGEVTELEIQPAEVTIEAGKSQLLDVIATFADGSTQEVSSEAIWESTDSNVAPVSSQGRVTGEFGGTAEVSAELQGVTDTIPVTVEQAFLEWLDESINTVSIPFGWLDKTISWLNREAEWVFSAIRWPVEKLLDILEGLFDWLPWYVTVLGIGLIGWWRLSWKAGLLFMAMMVLLGFLDEDIWGFAMQTLAMILTAVVGCAIVGIPVGIWAASSDGVYRFVRPALDAMQTIHPFIYLIPIIFFFGIGTVPGTIATFIFALPPVVRLTNLGIRQVPGETVEAARAFGSTDRQTLWEVQLPLARPAIMQGLNQSLMLAYSMVVIAAIVAAGGLGALILRATQRVDVPGAASSGLAVLILAVILDRLSQSQRAATEEAE